MAKVDEIRQIGDREQKRSECHGSGLAVLWLGGPRHCRRRNDRLIAGELGTDGKYPSGAGVVRYRSNHLPIEHQKLAFDTL